MKTPNHPSNAYHQASAQARTLLLIGYGKWGDVVLPSDTGNYRLNEVNVNTLLNSLIVYPNPFNEQITIETNTPMESDNVVIHLFDMRGRELLQKQINKGLTTTVIDMTGMAAGSYVVAMSVDDYAAGTKVVVKAE